MVTIPDRTAAPKTISDPFKAIRKNGQILATNAANGRVYLVDPQKSSHSPPIVAQFPLRTLISGIAEVDDDVFYVQDANGYVYNFTFDAGSNAVWEIDMRSYSPKHQPEASVRKVVDIPSAKGLNGMTLLSRRDGTLLLADSPAGIVYRLNVRTGAYEIVFDDPLLKPIPGSRPEFGVNGLRIVPNPNPKSKDPDSKPTEDALLYFTSTNRGLLATVPISRHGPTAGTPLSPPTILSSTVPNADDFAVDPRDGSVWLAENVRNTLVHVLTDGTVQTVAGGQNSTELIGPVSARFGRGEGKGKESGVLYVSTDGLTVDPRTGRPLTTNGKIVRIETRKCAVRD